MTPEERAVIDAALEVDEVANEPRAQASWAYRSWMRLEKAVAAYRKASSKPTSEPEEWTPEEFNWALRHNKWPYEQRRLRLQGDKGWAYLAHVVGCARDLINRPGEGIERLRQAVQELEQWERTTPRKG